MQIVQEQTSVIAETCYVTKVNSIFSSARGYWLKLKKIHSDPESL